MAVSKEGGLKDGRRDKPGKGFISRMLDMTIPSLTRGGWSEDCKNSFIFYPYYYLLFVVP